MFVETTIDPVLQKNLEIYLNNLKKKKWLNFSFKFVKNVFLFIKYITKNNFYIIKSIFIYLIFLNFNIYFQLKADWIKKVNIYFSKQELRLIYLNQIYSNIIIYA